MKTVTLPLLYMKDAIPYTDKAILESLLQNDEIRKAVVTALRYPGLEAPIFELAPIGFEVPGIPETPKEILDYIYRTDPRPDIFFDQLPKPVSAILTLPYRPLALQELRYANLAEDPRVKALNQTGLERIHITVGIGNVANQLFQKFAAYPLTNRHLVKAMKDVFRAHVGQLLASPVLQDDRISFSEWVALFEIELIEAMANRIEHYLAKRAKRLQRDSILKRVGTLAFGFALGPLGIPAAGLFKTVFTLTATKQALEDMQQFSAETGIDLPAIAQFASTGARKLASPTEVPGYVLEDLRRMARQAVGLMVAGRGPEAEEIAMQMAAILMRTGYSEQEALAIIRDLIGQAKTAEEAAAEKIAQGDPAGATEELVEKGVPKEQAEQVVHEVEEEAKAEARARQTGVDITRLKDILVRVAYYRKRDPGRSAEYMEQAYAMLAKAGYSRPNAATIIRSVLAQLEAEYQFVETPVTGVEAVKTPVKAVAVPPPKAKPSPVAILALAWGGLKILGGKL